MIGFAFTSRAPWFLRRENEQYPRIGGTELRATYSSFMMSQLAVEGAANHLSRP